MKERENTSNNERDISESYSEDISPSFEEAAARPEESEKNRASGTEPEGTPEASDTDENEAPASCFGTQDDNITEDAEQAFGEEVEPCDYSQDISVLTEQFPEMRGAKDISALKNPTRYTELRALGLSPYEAYLATSERAAVMCDNRRHLGSSVPRAAAITHGAISSRELREARELFGDISDSEIVRLYRKVTQNQ